MSEEQIFFYNMKRFSKNGRWLFLPFIFVTIRLRLISCSQDIPCGLQGTFNKILGGSLTEMYEFPWLARLQYLHLKNKSAVFGCSGTLISNQVVLTAAHCITYMQTQNLTIYVSMFIRLEVV